MKKISVTSRYVNFFSRSQQLPDPLPTTAGGIWRYLYKESWQILALYLVLTLLQGIGFALIPKLLGTLLDDALTPGVSLRGTVTSLVLLCLITSLVGSWRTLNYTALMVMHEALVMRMLLSKTSQLGSAMKRDISLGDAVATTGDDPENLGLWMVSLCNLLAYVPAMILVIYLMLTQSLSLGLTILVALPIITVLISWISKLIEKRIRTIREENGELTNVATDAVVGLRILRGIGGENAFNERYRAQSQRVKQAGIEAAPSQAALAVFSEAAPTLLTAAVVALGAQQVLSGQLQPGQLLTFFGYTSFLLLPMRAITELVVVNAFTRVSMRKVLRLLNIQPHVNDQASQPLELNSLGALHDDASGVTIAGGKLTALVAPSPEVSAALAMRLGRFDDADTVTLDGVDLRSLPLDQVRRTVVVSPTTAQAFAGPLYQAVLGNDAPKPQAQDTLELVAQQGYANSGVIATSPVADLPSELEARSQQALDLAHSDDLVDSVGGLYGLLNEKARNISGGQRQRLALARALATDAPVLVLLEPTSALDSHTENNIAADLAAERAGRTTVITTASPLILGRCDEVIFIDDDGAEVARGAHHQLRQQVPAYRAVVERAQGIQSAPPATQPGTQAAVAAPSSEPAAPSQAAVAVESAPGKPASEPNHGQER